MRTTFGTFNIATSGLFASQRSLSVASNNIANANTEGYSRQKVLQRATLPIGSDPRGVVGTGVEAYDIVRLRNEYVDTKYWGQVKSYNEWKAKSDGLTQVETIFNEPSDTGIRKVMDGFFAGIEELVKKAGDNTNRVNVLEKAVTLCNTINGYGSQIVDSIRDLNFTIKSKVSQVNALASQITDLNKQIFNMELDGSKANSLRDQRSTLTDELSKIVNITVSENTGDGGAKYYNIKIGGISLVNHYQVNKLTIDNSADMPIEKFGTGEISQIKWAGTDGSPTEEVRIESGALKGLLELRDGTGENNTYRGLPYYLEQLNRFSRDFAREFNLQHKAGMDLNGNPGVIFFEEPGNKWQDINCLNFKVSDAIRSNPSLLAAAGSNGGESDNANAQSLSQFRSKKDIFYDTSTSTKIKGTPDDFLKAVLSVLSVDGNQAERMMTNTEAIVEQTKQQRLSESGVLLNEEMTDMVRFQHAYNASARMITTLDKIMDTMINRLGMVGR
jgi:flagellar hook-associated protein 1 FlgK